MGIWLNMQTVDGTERPFPVSVPRLVIGRDSRCDVRIALPTVAPRHCEIAIEGALVTLKDLGSPSGTLHNGSRIERVVLEPGDRITVGLVTFVVRVEVADGALLADEPDEASHIAALGDLGEPNGIADGVHLEELDSGATAPAS